MSRMQVFWQTGLVITGLLAVQSTSTALAIATPDQAVSGTTQAGIIPNVQATLSAMMLCRQEPAALERLDCYDQVLAPEQSSFEGALVKARYEGEAWKRALAQEKQRTDNSTALMMTQSQGEKPAVIITTPAIGSLPPRPVLMFSCVDNITRMQVAMTHSMTQNDVAVTLITGTGRFQSHWFIRENGYLLEASRGLPGIDEIKQLFGSRTLTIDTGTDSAAGKLTFNIDGLAKIISPLREACHWAGE